MWLEIVITVQMCKFTGLLIAPGLGLQSDIYGIKNDTNFIFDSLLMVFSVITFHNNIVPRKEQSVPFY